MFPKRDFIFLLQTRFLYSVDSSLFKKKKPSPQRHEIVSENADAVVIVDRDAHLIVE